jgi:hypothetical protein
MVGQVDEAFEEISIKQHQTDQIYKAQGTLEDLIFIIIQESMTLKMIATYMRSFWRTIPLIM